MASVPAVVVVDIVIAADNFDSNINKLRTILAAHPHPQDVDGHPVLAMEPPAGEPPARWIHVNLSTGDRLKATVLLAIRDDNVYLIGFKAQSGTWFEFGEEGKSTRLIAGSTFLKCGPEYKNLVGGKNSKEVKAKLLQLQLGKSVAEEAVLKLSGYVPPPGAPDDATKLGLARLIVMFCESSRMISISDTIGKGWASGTRISDRQVDYMWNWGNMSEALLAWNMGRKPRGTIMKPLLKIGIKEKKDALAVVQLIKNRPPRAAADNEEERRLLDDAANYYDGHGRPLVEVFAVRAGFRVTGTIAIFDGIHGQIIYKQEHHRLQPPLELEGKMVLTGPYRAISADGSFAIKVDIDDNASGDNEGGMLTWNCYDDDRANTMYDVPLKDAINTTHGPVEVTYAVLTNAVEATVQVRLLLAQAAAGGLIHGEVTARSKAFDGVASVLFSHGSEHKVAVAANESMIPLNRSVISVPLDAPLVVEASFVYTPADACHRLDEVTIQGNFDFNPELSGDHVKRQFTEHGEIEVKVTWSDI